MPQSKKVEELEQQVAELKNASSAEGVTKARDFRSDVLALKLSSAAIDSKMSLMCLRLDREGVAGTKRFDEIALGVKEALAKVAALQERCEAYVDEEDAE